jgi:glucose-1-phosphate thymidylyltransferase
MASDGNRQKGSRLVGLVPAAGTAERISPIPCSKEILPIGFQNMLSAQGPRVKVAANYLLEQMKAGGADRVYVILRNGKWDIPAYLGSGRTIGIQLAYLMMDRPYGVPFTLDQAYPFVARDTVLFGFPDILFKPANAFRSMLETLSDTQADIVLGLFPARDPRKMDMVDLDSAGQIRAIDIKPRQSRMPYTWIIAVWTPAFTRFMHQFTENNEKGRSKVTPTSSDQAEVHVGHVIQEAIQENLRVDYVLFDQGDYLDIGTPEDLIKAGHFT